MTCLVHRIPVPPQGVTRNECHRDLQGVTLISSSLPKIEYTTVAFAYHWSFQARLTQQSHSLPGRCQCHVGLSTTEPTDSCAFVGHACDVDQSSDWPTIKKEVDALSKLKHLGSMNRCVVSHSHTPLVQSCDRTPGRLKTRTTGCR